MGMTESNRYRAGIIGLGFIGGADQVSGDALGQRVEHLGGTHLGALSNHPRVDLVAGSSRDPGRRERFAQRAEAAVFDDWARMLEQQQLDIVSVATYADVHAEIVLGCVDAGVRAIYCEKPIAQTVNDAAGMLEVCQRQDVLLAINHNRRFEFNHRRLRDYISEGGLGALSSVSAQWSAGRLGNVGTHMFDAILMLASRRAQAVSGYLDLAGKPDCRGPAFQDPGGWGMIRLEEGVMVTFDAADYASLPAVIQVNGIEGTARVGADGVHLDLVDGGQEHWPSIDELPMDRAVAEIVEALDGTTFPYDAELAVHTLEIIAAVHASHGRNGSFVDLPLTAEDRDLVVNSG
jgi:UDP-N-acetylglucosamine 3-dehydrogenase